MLKHLITILVVVTLLNVVGCNSASLNHYEIPQKVPSNAGLVQINVQDRDGDELSSYQIQFAKIEEDDTVKEYISIPSTAFGTSSTFQFIGALKPGRYKPTVIFYSIDGYSSTLNASSLGEFEVKSGQLTHLGTLIKSTLKPLSKLSIFSTERYSNGTFNWSLIPCNQDEHCKQSAANNYLIRSHFPKFWAVVGARKDYLEWTSLNYEIFKPQQRVVFEYLREHGLNEPQSSPIAYGRFGLLFDKKQGKRIKTNTPSEILSALKIDGRRYLYSTELAGLYESSFDKVSPLPFAKSSGKIVYLSIKDDQITAVHQERGIVSIFQTELDHWEHWQLKYQFENSGGLLMVVNSAWEFEEYNTFIINEDEDQLLLSYINDVLVLFDKTSGKITSRKYPFTIYDVELNKNGMLFAVEYSNAHWGDTSVHLSTDKGQSWKTYKHLMTRVAPIVGEDGNYYTLFFDEKGRDLDNTTLVMSENLTSWNPVEDISSHCKYFTHNQQVKLKMKECYQKKNLNYVSL